MPHTNPQDDGISIRSSDAVSSSPSDADGGPAPASTASNGSTGPPSKASLDSSADYRRSVTPPSPSLRVSTDTLCQVSHQSESARCDSGQLVSSEGVAPADIPIRAASPPSADDLGPWSRRDTILPLGLLPVAKSGDLHSVVKWRDEVERQQEKAILSDNIVARGASTRFIFEDTAAQTAYNTAEIRFSIFRLLSLSDLSRVMRVDKRSLKDAAELLYSEVKYNFADAIWSSDPIRLDIYRTSVKHIDARKIKITEAMRQSFEWCRELKKHRSLNTYDAKIADHLLPDLRSRFLGLRKISIGLLTPPATSARCTPGGTMLDLPAGYQQPACIISFDSTRESDGTDIYSADQAGRIEHFTTETIPLIARQASIITPPTPPQGSYTVIHRYDLILGESKSGEDGEALEQDADSATCRRWQSAIRDGSILDYSLKRLDVHQIPLTFDDLTSLFARQTGLDAIYWLEEITISQIDPWDSRQFRSFARVASNMTTLILGHHTGPLRSCQGWLIALADRTPTSLAFAELPAVISIVRNDLPNLIRFHFGLDVPRGVEKDCRKLLTERSLDDGGTIEDLQVFTRDLQNRPYNFWVLYMVRVLSGMCTAEAYIDIGWDGKADKWDHVDYLHYLRRQPETCRKMLATVEFSTLNVRTYSDVLALGYDSDGRPLPRKPIGREQPLTTRWFTEEESECSDYAWVAEQLDEMPAAPAAEKLRFAEILWEEYGDVKASDYNGVDVDSMRAYVEELRRIVAAGG